MFEVLVLAGIVAVCSAIIVSPIVIHHLTKPASSLTLSEAEITRRLEASYYFHVGRIELEQYMAPYTTDDDGVPCVCDGKPSQCFHYRKGLPS